MKTRQAIVLGLSFSAIAMALPQPGFSLDQGAIGSVTLHANVQKNDIAPPSYFSSLSGKPASLSKPKSKYGPVKKVATSAVSLVNFVFDVRGFDWSREGANAILEEKLKPKSEAAREFLRHREEDERELSIVAGTLQLASVEGKDEQKTRVAVENLAKLLGEEEAGRLQDKLKLAGTAGGADSAPMPADEKASVDVVQKCDRLRIILEAASETDPVVEVMTRRLHKYNHRSKFLQVTAKVVYVTMGIASFAPTLAAPIAETTLLTFMTVTGGPEQDKLLKEVYLSKCLQSRANLINEKADLAVECYDMAVLTKNERLLACSKDLIRQMTDEKAMAAFTFTPPVAKDIPGAVTGAALDTAASPVALPSPKEM
jgi:hypothetical protein